MTVSCDDLHFRCSLDGAGRGSLQVSGGEGRETGACFGAILRLLSGSTIDPLKIRLKGIIFITFEAWVLLKIKVRRGLNSLQD